MKYCIYLKKTEPEVSFSSGEHIFPAAIGGIQKLPQEYVSHNCNNAFSSMELGFMRDSLIAISRQFVGPGKRGNLSEKKATKSKISLMSGVSDPNSVEFGYISLAKPFSISQIRVKTNGSVHFISDASFGDADKTIMDFVEKMEKFSNNYTLIKDDKFAEDEFLLGFHDDQWYLGLSNEENISQVGGIIQKIIDQKLFENQTPKYGSIQPKVHLQMKIDIDKYYRVCAKIIFNYLAFVKGQDFVLKECFNPLRTWIVYGGENHFARQLGGSQKLFAKIPFPEESHKLMIVKEGSSLIGYIGFYGESFSTIIHLCDNLDESFELEGFICDWKNRKEFSVLNFLDNMQKEHQTGILKR